MTTGGTYHVFKIILKYVDQNPSKRFTTKDIASLTELSPTATSNNISRLAKEGILIMFMERKKGILIKYRINPYAYEALKEMYK